MALHHDHCSDEPWLGTYRKVKDAWENDIVIVCTPPVSHCSVTLQALESKRHVLCEKPLAMNQEESRSMLAKAREVEKLLGCCSPRFIGHHVTETLKSWVAERKFGSLYHVRWFYRGQGSRSGIVVGANRTWCFDSQQSGGGVLMDWGPYDMTAINDILQPVQVDVLHAWMAPPVSDIVLPEGAILDVEFHVGASMLYYCQDGTNYRAGTVIGVWKGADGGGTIKYTDFSTPDIGDTSDATFTMDLSAAKARLKFTSSAGTWIVSSSIRAT